MLTEGQQSPPSFVRRLRENPVLREMVKFMCVGVLSLTLSIIIFGIASDRLYHAIDDGKLRLLAANSIAFVITLTLAFFLNARFTFQQRRADHTAYVRYLMVNLVGFALNTGLLIMFTWMLASLRHETINQMHATFHIGEKLAYLAAVGCSFFWNFFMSRLWVFKRPSVPAGRKTLVSDH